MTNADSDKEQVNCVIHEHLHLNFRVFEITIYSVRMILDEMLIEVYRSFQYIKVIEFQLASCRIHITGTCATKLLCGHLNCSTRLNGISMVQCG